MNTKSSLQEQAYEYLKDIILSGRLEPDILYSETRMASEIGVSRTPMREALQCLSQDGYITVVPSKGFMLRKLSEEDMKATIQVRCAIEGFCVYSIAAEIDTKPAQKLLKELEKYLVKMEEAYQAPGGPRAENVKAGKCSRKQMDIFMKHDHLFHQTLIRYVGNPEFVQIFQRLMHLIHLTTEISLGVEGRTDDTLKEHRLIYKYLSEGDGEAAYKLMMVHLMTPLTMHLTERNSL